MATQPSPTHPPAALRRLASSDVHLPADVKPPGAAGRILEAGLGAFAERGFHGASIREIAASAGVKPATLYGHYPSKEHLLAELVRCGHEEHHRRLRAALLDSGRDPADQLTAVVKAHVASNAGMASLAVVCNSELHALSPELAAPALALREASEQLLLDVVERGVRLGHFEVHDPWLAVAAIGGMGIRVAYWLGASDARYTAEEVAEHYASFARRIVGSHATNENGGSS